MNNKLYFDKWAGDYDESILNSIDRYPFEKYYDVLSMVINKAEIEKGDVILDIGVGTGTLSKPLYECGYKIIGLDFSKEMLKKASEKMPNMIDIEYDMKKPMTEEVKKYRPDKAISTYAVHHLNIKEKVKFVEDILFNILDKDGVLVIGDVSFIDRQDFEKCRNENISYWDNEEDYLIFDILEKELKKIDVECEYTKIGRCGGVLTCKKI